MRNKVLSIITSAVPHPNIPINPGFSTPNVKSEIKNENHFLSTPTNKSNKIFIPPSKSNKKLLFLDLDETLVHSTFQKNNDADYVVPVIN
jgi:TFIIF-interacting CTD phosphatase-like protein